MMELALICTLLLVLAANVARMAYRLRDGTISTASTADCILLTLFGVAILVAIPYCILKAVGKTHDYWHIYPPIFRNN